MPESLSGSRWEQARCPCLKTVATFQQGFVGQSLGGGNRDHSGGYSVTPYATPDPACPTCGGTGRLEELVLRQGSWRFTSSYEPILMLTKGMSYWSNGEAVKEDGAASTHARDHYARSRALHKYYGNPAQSQKHSAPTMPSHFGDLTGHGSRNPRNVLHPPATPADHLAALTTWLAQEAPEVLDAYEAAQANAGDVLRLTPSPLSMGHYAAFPPSLPEVFIKASCPEQACSQCGAGWAPIITQTTTDRQGHLRPKHLHSARSTLSHSGSGHGGWATIGSKTTVHDLKPTCHHYCACVPEATPEPSLHMVGPESCPRCGLLCLTTWESGVVADCFSGSGTVGLVARELRRQCVLIEASPAYIQLSRQRLGLTELHAWEHGEAAVAPVDVSDLPLFGGRTK
jgi:hypothetical protein